MVIKTKFNVGQVLRHLPFFISAHHAAQPHSRADTLPHNYTATLPHVHSAAKTQKHKFATVFCPKGYI